MCLKPLPLSAALLTAFLANAAFAQSPKAVLIGQPLGVAVDKSLGWKAHSDPGVDNADLLNASLADSSQRYAIYFPGQRWNVQETLVNTYTGRRWCGNGLARLDGGSGFNINNGPVSQIVWNKNQLDFDGSSVNATAPNLDGVDFDGSSNTATSPAGSSAVISVTSGSVPAGYLHCDLRITAGDNFAAGVYRIMAISGDSVTLDRDPTPNGNAGSAMQGTLMANVITVTAGHTPDAAELYYALTIDSSSSGFSQGIYEIIGINGNDYTLDRDPATAAAGTTLVGTVQATMLRDESYGAVYDGITLKGSPNFVGGLGNPANRCAVGHHALVDLGDPTPNTSKAHLENYSIADCDIAVLCGHGLAKFGAASNNFFGADWNNADHVTLTKGLMMDCDYGFVTRTTQGLSYTVTDLHTSAVRTLFYLERGGKFTARGVWTTTNEPNNGGGPTLLRIGGASDGVTQSATVSSPIVIDGGTFDAPSEDLKLLEMDGPGNS